MQESNVAGKPLEGEFVAVAYGNCYYVGKICKGFTKEMFEASGFREMDEVDFLSVRISEKMQLNFFAKEKVTQNFYWPATEDVPTVKGKFIFINKISMKPSKDRQGHFSVNTWHYTCKKNICCTK